MKIKSLGILAAGAAIAGSVVLAAPANAGGSGDFYKTDSCSTPYGVANITNYDSDNYTTQTYHHGLKPYSGYYVGGVRYNGSTWNASYTGMWGTKADGYAKFSNETADVRVTAVFTSAGGKSYTCDMYAR